MIYEYIKIVIILIITVLFIKEIVQYKRKRKFNKMILISGIYISLVYISIIITILNERPNYIETKDMINGYLEVYNDESITKELLEEEIMSEYYNDKEIGNSETTQSEYIDRLIAYNNGEIETIYEYEDELDISKRELGFGRLDEKVEQITIEEVGKLVMADYRDSKEIEYGKVYGKVRQGLKEFKFGDAEPLLPLFLKERTKYKIYAMVSPRYREYRSKNEFTKRFIGSESTNSDLSTLIGLDIAMKNGVFDTMGSYDLPEQKEEFLGSSIEINGSTQTVENWLSNSYSEALYVMYGDAPEENTSLDSIAD